MYTHVQSNQLNDDVFFIIATAVIYFLFKIAESEHDPMILP